MIKIFWMNKKLIFHHFFWNRVIVVVSNLFATANKCRRFLIGSLESLLQLPLSQLSLYSRTLKTIFCKNRLKSTFRETFAHFKVNKTKNRGALDLYMLFQDGLVSILLQKVTFIKDIYQVTFKVFNSQSKYHFHLIKYLYNVI